MEKKGLVVSSVFEILVAIAVILVMYYAFLATTNVARTHKIEGIEKDIEIAEDPKILPSKLKVCTDDRKIILNDVAFKYKDKLKLQPFFVFKGAVVAGYKGQDQDTGKYEVELIPDKSGGHTIFSRTFTAPPADASLYATSKEETFVFGFLSPNNVCEDLLKKGTTIKDFTENSYCSQLIVKSYFMRGVTGPCGPTSLINPPPKAVCQSDPRTGDKRGCLLPTECPAAKRLDDFLCTQLGTVCCSL